MGYVYCVALWYEVGERGYRWETSVPDAINFIGRFDHNLDAKNRLMVPQAYRDVAQRVEGTVKFYINRGLDKCVAMYTASSWDGMASMLAARKASEFAEEEARKFRRVFFSSAAEVVPDKAGRILIPDHLREFAGLKKEVVLMGAGDRIEIWDAEEWAAYSRTDEGEYEQSAREAFRSA